MQFENDQVLIRRSVEAILRNQSNSGAIIASPDFAEYHFSWLRDSSFCSYALDLAGEHEASEKYHRWVDRAVRAIADVIDNVIDLHQRGQRIDPTRMPPARFSLDGTVVVDDWPNFQIDGYGTWLWAFGQHLELTGQHEIPKDFVETVRRVARYVATFAFNPCFDVWEEYGDAQHTSTLACVFAGLMTAGRLLDDDAFETVGLMVQRQVIENAAQVGYFVKSSISDEVDASTLWLTVPFQLVEPSDECFAQTVMLIEERLTFDGGIRRYPSDVYFGSGAWPVLTASLGWHYAVAGNIDRAELCRSWVAARFSDDGKLAEQFGGEYRDPSHFDEWVERWGPPAADLTWSHAMYVVLAMALDRTDSALNVRLSAAE